MFLDGECPYCKGQTECQIEDVGFGYNQQVGPYICIDCNSYQILLEESSQYTEEEQRNLFCRSEFVDRVKIEKEELRKELNRSRLEKVDAV